MKDFELGDGYLFVRMVLKEKHRNIFTHALNYSPMYHDVFRLDTEFLLFVDYVNKPGTLYPYTLKFKDTQEQIWLCKRMQHQEEWKEFPHQMPRQFRGLRAVHNPISTKHPDMDFVGTTYMVEVEQFLSELRKEKCEASSELIQRIITNIKEKHNVTYVLPPEKEKNGVSITEAAQ